ncbi:hypothetical protein JW960_22610 [candidate division KSB1 bacterium]|nr:hypothetical protein [candidate division KSB1 bacterium]
MKIMNHSNIVKYTALICLFTLNCAGLPFIGHDSSERTIMLEPVGDTQVRQLYIDGFEQLSVREKLFVYHVTLAGIAGRDIFCDQNHKYALAIRNLCETVWLHTGKLDRQFVEKLDVYLQQFWINSCQYGHYSQQKFVPTFTCSEFEAALSKLQSEAIEIPIPGSLSITAYLDQLEPYMFDATFQPMLTVKNPPPGADIITASANNLFENINLQELEAWEKAGRSHYPSNSRVVKQDTTIIEQVFRAGLPDSNVAPGRYATELKEVIRHLRDAQVYADSVQSQVIDLLVLYYQTGHDCHMNELAKLWIRHQPQVDFLQGFMEAYIDPRGQKASFENLVYFEDIPKTEIMHKLVELVPYLEVKAPFADKYKRTDFSAPPTAIAALVVSGTGDCGPIVPAGLNLPNSQHFRETYGSKNLIFTNILGISGGNNYSWERDYARRYVYEFFHPDDIEELLKVNEDAAFAMVCLHELIGHGSGRIPAGVEGDPADSLHEFYSTIEETRAELSALWNIHEPRLFSIGLVPSKRAADEVYRQWARYGLLQLTTKENRTTIEEDHERARNLIINYVRAHGGIDMVKTRGKLFTRVTSIDAFHAAVGELLAKIMRIKAEGDYSAAKALVETYGIHFNLEWRDQMVARYKKLQQEGPVIIHRGYTMPYLEPIYNSDGSIRDIRVKYLCDFPKEQLFYSGKIEMKK